MSRIGRTVTEMDNVQFTTLTMNTNQVHFNAEYARASLYGRPLVNSAFTLSLVVGLSIPDTSENAAADLGWGEVRLPAPVFVDDPLWAASEVLAVRASSSRPDTGIVEVRTRGLNQHGETSIEFTRAFLVYASAAAAHEQAFPDPTADWQLPADVDGDRAG
jgi:acyl dehydratase